MVIYSRAKKPHPFMNEGGFKAFYKDRNISPSWGYKYKWKFDKGKGGSIFIMLWMDRYRIQTKNQIDSQSLDYLPDFI